MTHPVIQNCLYLNSHIHSLGLTDNIYSGLIDLLDRSLKMASL